MNLDSIAKLCNMIANTYRIIASYFDSDGKLINQSAELKKEDFLNDYLEQCEIILEQCRINKDIQIYINEVVVTMIGITVMAGDIVRGFIVLGPFQSSKLSEKVLMEIVDKVNISEDKKASFLNYQRIITICPYEEYIKIIKVIYFLLYGEELEGSKLDVISKADQESRSKFKESLNSKDEMEIHGSYLFERCMLECIRTGNLVNLNQVLQSGSTGRAGTMIIGNELRQAKNTFIVATSIATRAAIDGGLNCESAYSISDLYIRQIEMMKSVEEIATQTVKMFYDFCGRVHELLKVNAYSYYVNQCCDYIQTNIYNNFSVNQIAETLGISQEHLSRVFKHETGMPVIEYIKKIKIKEAKFLLKFTDHTLVEISAKLAFSSQSHFNTVFKSEMGLTPKQYRDKVKIVSKGSLLNQ